MNIKIATSEAEIQRCFSVIAELRPHLIGDTFVSRVRELQERGYELAYLEDNGEPQAAAGFRVSDMLSRGPHMYVDDLVTKKAGQSRGYGAALFQWLVELACERGCKRIDLDSGVQRHTAHRFYFRHGMQIASYHFTRHL